MRKGVSQFKEWASEIKKARETDENKETELEILEELRRENNITVKTYEEQQHSSTCGYIYQSLTS